MSKKKRKDAEDILSGYLDDIRGLAKELGGNYTRLAIWEDHWMQVTVRDRRNKTVANVLRRLDDE